MKERPILFSAPMVRALLDGGKTQTRRVVKQLDHSQGACTTTHNGTPMQVCWAFGGPVIYCPYGVPGDQLWVRETFQPLFAKGWEHGVGDRVPDFETGEGYKIGYPATDGAVEWIDGDDNITSRSKPSIHMPRWASRLQLEIVSVRVERLQEISEADAKAEGVAEWARGACAASNPHGYTNVGYYWLLWEQINGAGSWDANPWVWVIEFRRIAP